MAEEKKKNIDNVPPASPVGNLTLGQAVAQVAPSAQSEKKAVIRLTHVNKSFDLGRTVVHVLKDISIEIFPQEFVVILGPSGSGKSTVLNLLLGLEEPSSGEVFFRDNKITGLKQDKIAKLRFKTFGVVFQRSEWVRAMNVMQNVALPLAIAGVARKQREDKAWEKIRMLGMESHGKYIPTELSGGQQQKITIARALVTEPDIIIADEPTGSLDSASADKVMEMLRILNEDQKKTIIMVTHNIDYVRFASRTIYIRDGRVIQGSEQFLQ